MREISFYSQGSTTYLVLKLDAADRLDSLAMGMMTNNEIFGLLSVSPRRIDQEEYLYYSISSLTPLAAGYGALSSDKRLLVFLRSLCRLAAECQDYLLDPSGLLLDPQYVYIQLSTGEIRVPYLPLEGETGGLTPYQFVRDLAAKLGASFPADSRVMPVLYRLVLAEGQFSLPALDEQLAQLQTAGAVQTDRRSGAEHAASAHEPPAPPAPLAEEPHPRRQQPAPPPAVPSPAPGADMGPAGPEEPAPGPAPQPAGGKDTLIRKLFGSGAGKPAPAPKPGKVRQEGKKPAAGFGFAVPGAAPAPKGSEDSAPAPEAPPAAPRKGPVWSKPAKQKTPVQPKTPVPPQPPAPPKAPMQPQAPVQPRPASAPPQGQGGYTFILDGTDSGAPLATSSMLGGDVPREGAPAPLWLVRRANGQRVQVTHSNFHIGRGQDLVDFSIVTTTQYVGIDHGYILIQDGAYFYVDNNSRNHSWLNGRQLEGSRPYPLHTGDTLRLADEYFDVVSG